MDISIVLPAFNEERRLADSVDLIEKAAASLTPNYEIIIVNDGSKDKTLYEANRLIKRNISVISYEENQGKGYAVKQGMLKAQGKIHLFMDVDLATDLKALAEFYLFMKNNPVDIVIGDRKTDSNSQHIKQPHVRQVLGKGFTWLSQILLNCPFHDFTCGFKMFTSEASWQIFSLQQIKQWSFDSEILFIAQKLNLKVNEMPVIWRHQGNSKVRPFNDVLSSLAGLIRIKLNDSKGLYNH